MQLTGLGLTREEGHKSDDDPHDDDDDGGGGGGGGGVLAFFWARQIGSPKGIKKPRLFHMGSFGKLL